MWVKIRIQPLKGSAAPPIETTALVNSGFQARKPELIVPARVAELLGVWPNTPAGTVVMSYGTAGAPIDVYRIADGAQVWVVATDRTRGPALCDLSINRAGREAIMSEPLGGDLDIVLELGRGSWHFGDEPDIHRPSEPRQIW